MEIAKIDVVRPCLNDAVTGPAYIGKHRQDPQAKTPGTQAGDPGPDGVLAAQVIVIGKDPSPRR